MGVVSVRGQILHDALSSCHEELDVVFEVCYCQGEGMNRLSQSNKCCCVVYPHLDDDDLEVKRSTWDRGFDARVGHFYHVVVIF